MAHQKRLRRNGRTRRGLLWGWVLLLVGSSLSWAGSPAGSLSVIQTAYPLGKGGLSVAAGVLNTNTQLPRGNQPPITTDVVIDGRALPYTVNYRAEGGLVPLAVGWGVGRTTDLYLTASLFGGESRKRIQNFYRVPPELLRTDADRFDRIYEQPVFDFGLAFKYQLKPELGDGLPAAALWLHGRWGYTGDDVGRFRDETPADGFPDFGGTALLALSLSLGDLLVLHSNLGFAASRKLNGQLLLGAAAELNLIPDRLSLIGEYVTRRDVAGFEYPDLGDRLGLGVRYLLSSSRSLLILAAPGGHLFLGVTATGERPTPLKPEMPAFEEGLF